MSAADNFLSISQLNAILKSAISTIAKNFEPLKIQGEISNFVFQKSSGHCYFSLKDKNAQIRCTIWKFTYLRNKNLRQNLHTLANGKLINVLAKPSFYETKGEIQLNIEDIFVDNSAEKNNHGELHLKLQRLREKLSAEGLFDIKHKKNIPNLVENIAIVTSRQAAALQDVLRTLHGRIPFVKITLFETPVQGSDNEETAKKIVSALRAADSGEFGNFDVILLCRGGGSIEDLWAFNEEILARAIFDCKTPVITGIGHEIDNTLADDVADIRAVTPTAAAQEVSKFSKDDLLQSLWNIAKKLQQNLVENFANKQQNLDFLRQRIFSKTSANSPNNLIKTYKEKLSSLRQRLTFAINNKHMYQKLQSLQLLKHKLLLLNPENVLQRGYVYVSNAENNQIYSDTKNINLHDKLLLNFKDQQKLSVEVISKNLS